MRLFILGANGKTGTQLVDVALARGHQVTAFVRSPAKITRRHPRLEEGAERIAAFVAATSRRAALDVERRELNGQPALVFYREGRPFAAILLAVADGRIQRVFFHADLGRLRYLGRAL